MAADYYYQIHSGVVKLNNVFEDGKEFIHDFPFEGHCFGERVSMSKISYFHLTIPVQ